MKRLSNLQVPHHLIVVYTLRVFEEGLCYAALLWINSDKLFDMVYRVVSKTNKLICSKPEQKGVEPGQATSSFTLS